MERPRDVGRVIERPGPWRHRYVAANGARFHVADVEPNRPDAPLVLMLHGFPEFWWTWRDQLPALAAAGYRAAAMDLRGYGASDKTPRGYDPVTLAQDVSGVVKALGERQAVLVGHGWGGYVAWAAAVLHPSQVAAICPISAPHPLPMLRAVRRHPAGPAAWHVLQMQPPWRPERRVARADGGYVAAHLRAWSAPGSTFPDAETAAVYQEAISLWPSSHCALEYHRWLFRSRLRSDGREFSATMRHPVTQPVCAVTGERDPVTSAATVEASRRWVTGPFATQTVAGSGHFPHEERSALLTDLLLAWLAGL